MKNIQGVHHVSISVPDIELARTFYIELLGAREVFAFEWQEGNAFVNEIVGLPDCPGKQFMARLGDTYLEVFEYVTPRDPAPDLNRPVNLCGYTHFGLQVDDINAVYERMVAAGVRFHTAPKHCGGPETDGVRKLGFISTYGRDYFGNVFELIEINAGSAIQAL
jgi:catechol 2,3-dioxygenase-like lactoylglutathione lyase family enzyme